jgi:beta-lactamase regulating signal transducer with metallopeptidase domain
MLWWLAQNAVLAALLAVLVALACRLGRFRPAVRHALWLVVLLKLVTPPGLVWPGLSLSFSQEPEPQVQAEPREEPTPMAYQFVAPVPQDLIVSLIPVEDAPATPELSAPAATEEPPTVPPAAPHRAAIAWQWPEWLVPLALRVILFGAGGMAMLQLIRLARFRRLLARGEPAPIELSTEVEELAARLHVRPPEVCVLRGIVSPLVCGLGRPLLLWPDGLSGRLTPECQRAVIIHELAHLRRRDHWIAWLQTLAGCVWWWNPVYWYVARQLGRNAELACDAWVIAALPKARRAYAEALLAIAGRMSRTAALAPAVGMSGSRRDFERRLIMVMRDSVPCKAPILGLVAIGVLALAVLPGLSLSQQQDKPKITKPDQPTQPTTVAPQPTVTPYVATDIVADPATIATIYGVQAGDDRDRKFVELEKKLQALLKEVQALRSPKTTTQPTAKPKATDKKPTAIYKTPDGQVLNWSSVPVNVTYSITADGQQHAINLSRVHYKLAKEKADALAAFLKHIKASVLESKLEDDGITITTTPDVQQTMRHLVGLMEGKTQGANVWYKPVDRADVPVPVNVAPVNVKQSR